ncbi:HET-domain-containing protein [Bimuria novae-zelandiae CBS 107.79]|uniref:HET-domain-containing protein n=1 Tax=Bimuria novae-zelandiae CBS 107.79 TaxID=1447943 RepID=A0A6A5VQP1_9PLEO|nr:HET-domain-containing protein [Bimuria novae-zelandiae CBS 107.79]
MPTRLLRIAGDLNSPSVTLVECNGMRGIYRALNYCWGPPDKRPLAIKIENIRQHLSVIPFEKLPRTFRDAELLVRSLEIGFLWIDSLCIIQDDKDEWTSEAQKMSMIYSNAVLVIAAAGARDSTEGLFIADRPLAKSYFARERSTKLQGLGFQEWRLARRLVFFMPGGLSWRCNKISEDERGNNSRFYPIWVRNSNWYKLLEEYTSKELTYPTDRLHAIRGIVTAADDNRLACFSYENGMWSDQMLEQVLWTRVEPARTPKFSETTYAELGRY